MREVGVRELKASLSELLQLAGRGERVRVTVHGRPVADIVAPGAADEEDVIGSLVGSGRLVPPSRPRPKRAPLLASGSGSASALVLGEREAERDRGEVER
ncbi:MAG: type II toxin-antitoxin system Phd/YefM family antitoxin [Solirubrobacteraceae bacterium]